jgi:hypothetical protein
MAPRKAEMFYVTFDCYHFNQARTRILSVLPGPGPGPALGPKPGRLTRTRADFSSVLPQSFNDFSWSFVDFGIKVNGNKMTKIWWRLFSEMFHSAVWQILSNVSQEFTASIIRTISRLQTRRRKNLKSPPTTVFWDESTISIVLCFWRFNVPATTAIKKECWS